MIWASTGFHRKDLSTMTRFISLSVVTLLTAVTLSAQSPDGWKVRLDRSTNANDPDAAGDVQFTSIPGGFHAVNPAAAVFWNPANTASGAYTLKGTFKLMEPSGHENTYGLVFGGSALEGADQHYLYFLISQEGNYLIKQRAGDRMPDPNAPAGRGGRGRGPMPITADVVAKTMHASVQKPGADGTSTNTLEVRVKADAVDFVINGTVVHTAPKAGLPGTADGIAGIRVNHQLNVQITGFAITR
jgi:hypothetical protein